MKTKTIVALLFVVALSITAGMALAQDASLARLQPLLVDIQQQIPVDVTFAVEGTEPQTVTVPMTLDLNLQIELSSALTPVVSVGAVGPALVSVSELMAQGEPLVDNSGLAYEVDSVEGEGVEVVQLRTDEDFSGQLQLTGEVRNVSDEELPAFRVNLVVTVYDEDGRILGAATGYPALPVIRPGQSSPFTVLTQTPMDEVGWYLVQLGGD